LFGQTERAKGYAPLSVGLELILFARAEHLQG